MQLTPSQMGMSLMIHGWLPMLQYESRAEGIARGRQQLKLVTGDDHVYDLRAWHRMLIETNAGGYKWGNKHRRFAKEIEAAVADESWQQDVAKAVAESLLERIEERDQWQRDVSEQAERQWAGKVRSCPKCSTEFTSVRDRGQCPHCGEIFYASHPLVGRKMWWLEDE